MSVRHSLKHELFNSLPCFLIKVLQCLLLKAEEFDLGLASEEVNPYQCINPIPSLPGKGVLQELARASPAPKQINT